MKIINVVLTGGVGSRLWPLSRKNKPKQYLDLFEGKSLFQHTVLRNKDCSDELMIVGNVDNSELTQKALSNIGITFYNEIIEAIPRNTTAAIALAAFNANSEDILLVTPSDHLIEDLDNYHESIYQAIQIAKKGSIVTFGLTPTKPETGYGYIQIKNNKVLSFREKPSEETAKDFLKQGGFYWNSGMFCFKAGVFLDELMELQSEVYFTAKNVFDMKSEDNKLPLTLSLQIPTISVDYAVMERTNKLQAVIGAFKWSDMGSFDSFYDYLVAKGHPLDKNGNMVLGTKQHTEFLGLNECILIVTDDVLLILKKENSQDVKKIYSKIEKSHSHLL